MIEPTGDEREVEQTLRPSSLSEFVGQQKVVSQIELLISAAKLHNRTPDHILLAGPPGLGKTTLAMIVAQESNRTKAHLRASNSVFGRSCLHALGLGFWRCAVY